jgi:ribosomal protein L23
MGKTELKQLLTKVYDVDVAKVNTINYLGTAMRFSSLAASTTARIIVRSRRPTDETGGCAFYRSVQGSIVLK